MPCDLEIALRNAKLKSVVHFTPISNLGSILDHGLLSRASLARLHLRARFVDDARLDRLLDYICVTLNEPNRYMLRRVMERFPDEEFVILKFRPNFLWAKDCLFFPDNAACSDCRDGDLSRFSGADAFARFLGIQAGRFGHPDVRRSQKEILVRREVETSFLDQVLFRSHASLARFASRLARLHVTYTVGTFVFDMSPLRQ